jgi:hypothetical protein
LFHLSNPDVEARKFKAFFTPDSPRAFSVTPATGVMDAGAPLEGGAANAGAPDSATPRRAGLTSARGRFEVSAEAIPEGPGVDLRIGYAPEEYGTDLVGRLLVVTEENTWNFEVLGTTPRYVKPVAAARVDAKISEKTEALVREAKKRNANLGNIVLRNTKPENYTSRKVLSKREAR